MESLSQLSDAGPSSSTTTPFTPSGRSHGYLPPPITPPSPSKRPRTSTTTSPSKRRKRGSHIQVEPSESPESEERDEAGTEVNYDELDGRDSSIPSDAAEEPGLATIENDPFGLLPVPSTDNTPQPSPNPASATLGSPIEIPGPPSSHSPSDVGTPRPSTPPNGAGRFRFQDLDEGHESVDLSVGSLRTRSLADTASNQSTPIEWSPTSSQARRSLTTVPTSINPRRWMRMFLWTR